MPELNEVVGTDKGTGTAVAGTTETGKPETTAAAAAGTSVVDATVVGKKVKKEKVKKEKPAESAAKGTAEGTEPAAVPAKKGKTEASDSDDAAKKPKDIPPPMEQIAHDVERLILDKKIAGHDIKKLQYKCGKNIYGLPGADSKDFRVMALKARKKTKNVAGKSRCIYYFGINEDHSAIVKEIPSTKTTTFGKCSVQSKKPIELVLDKVTYKEHFDQDSDKVVAAIKKLIDITVEQKNTQYKAIQEAAKAKEKVASEKAEKKSKKEKAEAAAD